MRYFLIVGIFCLSFISCKNDKDKDPPVIKVIKPYENKQYSVFDTIFINALITDASIIQRVDYSLTDENKIPVTQTTTLYFDKNEITVNAYLPISNKNLISGNYYLWIRATDGDNVRDKYVQVYIHELELKLEKIFLFGYVDTTTVNVYVNNNSSFNKAFDYNSDYLSSAINSQYGILYTCGKYYGNLKAFQSSDYSTLWEIPVVSNPPFPYFTDIYYYNKLLYCSFYNGFVKAYDNNGSVKFSANAPNALIPEKIRPIGNFLFCDHSQLSGNTRVFGLYYLVSGASKQQIFNSLKVVDIFYKNSGSVFVFGNETGQGRIYLYNIDGNGWWESHPVPSGFIYDVASVDSENYLIAHTNGIYRYDYSLNSLTVFKSGTIFTKIKYDKVSNELYALSGNQLKIFNYPDGSLNDIQTLPDQLLDIQLLYNK